MNQIGLSSRSLWVLPILCIIIATLAVGTWFFTRKLGSEREVDDILANRRQRRSALESRLGGRRSLTYPIRTIIDSGPDLPPVGMTMTFYGAYSWIQIRPAKPAHGQGIWLPRQALKSWLIKSFRAYWPRVIAIDRATPEPDAQQLRYMHSRNLMGTPGQIGLRKGKIFYDCGPSIGGYLLDDSINADRALQNKVVDQMLDQLEKGRDESLVLAPSNRLSRSSWSDGVPRPLPPIGLAFTFAGRRTASSGAVYVSDVLPLNPERAIRKLKFVILEAARTDRLAYPWATPAERASDAKIKPPMLSRVKIETALGNTEFLVPTALSAKYPTFAALDAAIQSACDRPLAQVRKFVDRINAGEASG